MGVENTGGSATEVVEFARPSIAEVHEVLRAHGALLAHFSSYPPMDSQVGASPRFPDDLIRVLNRQCPGGVCCSAFTPSDLGAGGNVSGYIGALLRPASDQSIIVAAPHDIGSNVRDGKREFILPLGPVSRAHLESSITERANSEWNEWIVDHYEPVGLITVGEGVGYGAGKKSPEELRDIFGFPVYRFEAGRLVRLHGDTWVVAEHGELYP